MWPRPLMPCLLAQEVLSRGKFAEVDVDNRGFTSEEETYIGASAMHAYESFRNKAASSRGMEVRPTKFCFSFAYCSRLAGTSLVCLWPCSIRDHLHLVAACREAIHKSRDGVECLSTRVPSYHSTRQGVMKGTLELYDAIFIQLLSL